MTKTKTSIWSNHRNSAERIRTFVDEFIRSEFMQEYHSEAIQADFGLDGRFARYCDASEHGSDGSTHREVINDWRRGFDCWMRERNRGKYGNQGDRLSAAAHARFDKVEQWHIDHGSIEEVL